MKVVSKLINPELKEGFLRVAFASSDDTTINEHFGWAESFMIYDVSRYGFHKVGRIQFSSDVEMSECYPESRHFIKINELASCHIVYSQSIGGPAAARLTQRKIHPMVVKNNRSITAILESLKTVLKSHSAPPWVRKIIQKRDPTRFDN